MATNDNREVTGYIVDAKTAEIKQELRRGDKVIPMRLYDQPKPDKNYLRSGGDFAKIQKSAFAVLREKTLTPTEWALLWFLCAHVRYNNGIVCHRNGRRFTARCLADRLGREEKTVRTALHKLKREGFVMWRRENGGYAIWLNPYFVVKGQLIENGLHDTFCHTEFYRVFCDESN